MQKQQSGFQKQQSGFQKQQSGLQKQSTGGFSRQGSAGFNRQQSQNAVPVQVESSKTLLARIPTADYWLETAVSFLSGLLTFYIYYEMCMTITALNYRWASTKFIFLLGGCQYFMATVVSIFMLPYNALTTRYLYVSCGIYVLVSVLFPLAATSFPGKENFQAARVSFVSMFLLVGVADGLQSFSGFSLAANFSKSRIAIYFGGKGMAGAIPFVQFLLMSGFFYQSSTRAVALWVYFAVGGLFSVVQIGCLTALRMRPWFRKFMTKSSSHHYSQFVPGESSWEKIFLRENREERADWNKMETETGPEESFDLPLPEPKLITRNSKSFTAPRNFIQVVKDCRFQALSSFILIFSTLAIYPNLTPNGLPLDEQWIIIILGLGHISHTTLRVSPAYMKFLQIKKKYVLPTVITRSLIFVPYYVTIYLIHGIPGISSPWFISFIQIIFAATYGWLGTLTTMYALNNIRHPQEKAVATKFIIIIQLLAGTFGIIAGFLVTLF